MLDQVELAVVREETSGPMALSDHDWHEIERKTQMLG